jgi:hypothetical protein
VLLWRKKNWPPKHQGTKLHQKKAEMKIGLDFLEKLGTKTSKTNSFVSIQDQAKIVSALNRLHNLSNRHLCLEHDDKGL